MDLETVLAFVAQMETQRNIDIVYAALGGSHGFNTARSYSDYDIYFVYTGDIPKTIREYYTYDDKTYSLSAIHKDVYQEIVDAGMFFSIDNLRASTVYINDDDFANTILNNADVDLINMQKSLRGLINTRYKHCISTTQEPESKKYLQAGLALMRLYWIIENNTYTYPLDFAVLLELYTEEIWYDELKYVHDNREEVFMDRQTQLDLIFLEVS